MRLAALRYWKQKSDSVGEGPRPLGAAGERIGVLSVRLDELQQSVEELYRLLERLESDLPAAHSANASRLALHLSQERSRFESDYWLG